MLINIGIWESAGRLCSRMLYAGWRHLVLALSPGSSHLVYAFSY
jgi:hypothetical protein